MKIRTAIVVVVLAFLTSTVFAVGYIGPPTAGLNTGQWGVGFNYSYSSQDLDTIKIKWHGTGDDEGPYTESGSFKLKNKDTDIQMYMGRISYGISDQWEVYGQFGIADLKSKFKDTGDDEWYGINFDNDFAWGFGTKITFAKQDKIDWGVAFQMNWLDTSWDDKYTDSDTDDGGPWTESGKQTLDVETYDILITVGPTVDMGCWKLYGGPFYYMISGDYDYEDKGTWQYTETEGSGWWNYKESGDADMDTFGGYVGAQIEVAKNWDMTAEFSFAEDGWGLGAGVTYKF